jgi:hypothetical protein
MIIVRPTSPRRSQNAVTVPPDGAAPGLDARAKEADCEEGGIPPGFSAPGPDGAKPGNRHAQPMQNFAFDRFSAPQTPQKMGIGISLPLGLDTSFYFARAGPAVCQRWPTALSLSFASDALKQD